MNYKNRLFQWSHANIFPFLFVVCMHFFIKHSNFICMTVSIWMCALWLALSLQYMKFVTRYNTWKRNQMLRQNVIGWKGITCLVNKITIIYMWCEETSVTRDKKTSWNMQKSTKNLQKVRKNLKSPIAKRKNRRLKRNLNEIKHWKRHRKLHHWSPWAKRKWQWIKSKTMMNSVDHPLVNSIKLNSIFFWCSLV